MPNTITDIKNRAFYGCTGLTELTIPCSVKSILDNVFTGCQNLATIIVEQGNTVYDSRDNCNAIIRTADNTLLQGCQNTVIPNSVNVIESKTFYNCQKLKTINIPAGVTAIGQMAFYGCIELEIIKTYITEPFEIDNNTFSNNTTFLSNVVLQVPHGCIAKYQAQNGWKKFTNIEELGKCATPKVSIKNGKFHFECETEGVDYHANIETPASFVTNGNDINVPAMCVVTVYASKEGLEDSDVSIVEVDIRGIKGDVNEDGKVSITDAVSVVNIILNGGEATAAPALNEPEEAGHVPE